MNHSDPFQLQRFVDAQERSYEIAIEEGSTIVRVGTAIFGSRTLV